MNEPYTGIGINPDGPDLPLGFGMRLAESPEAVKNYAAMSKDEQTRLIKYIQGGSTGDDAARRISAALNGLQSNNLNTIFEGTGN